MKFRITMLKYHSWFTRGIYAKYHVQMKLLPKSHTPAASRSFSLAWLLAVVDPGEGPGGPGPSPHFWTKMRPEGQKNFFWRPPSPLSQGLDDCTPPPPPPPLYLKVWIRHCLACTKLFAWLLRRVNKPNARQTSHANDLVNAKSHAREKPLLAAVQILLPFLDLENTTTIAL